MNNLNHINEESIKTADQETLESWFAQLQEWSQSRKDDSAFQDELALNRKDKKIGVATLEVARNSVLANRVKKRLAHTFGRTIYRSMKI